MKACKSPETLEAVPCPAPESRDHRPRESMDILLKTEDKMRGLESMHPNLLFA